ncbi:hypothetical protein SAMN05444156_2164 [Verrucomicrobium sp. GAS474]|uniref:hypothetical protein n=1 Tax=Verrucomicrobium sp. GAS474 TaxID=1882831 RepID=UPI00087A0355|nr:hypothetical protein [Verrucomicrobium sp. GAS474]SDU13460.1 hypothetical protein SAMN05444156_2164 [Verrucomicrobium sp. GAS474]
MKLIHLLQKLVQSVLDLFDGRPRAEKEWRAKNPDYPDNLPFPLTDDGTALLPRTRVLRNTRSSGYSVVEFPEDVPLGWRPPKGWKIVAAEMLNAEDHGAVRVPGQRLESYPMDMALFNWDGTPLAFGANKTAMLIQHLFENIFAWGKTGSGKTSGTGRRVWGSCCRFGLGLLGLAVKMDEPAELLRQALAEGRQLRPNKVEDQRPNDIRMFGPDHGERFNFASYHGFLTNRMGTTAETVEVLNTIIGIAKGNSADVSKHDFWAEQRGLMLQNAIDIVRHRPHGEIKLEEIMQLIDAAPTKAGVVNRESVLDRWGVEALQHVCTSEELRRRFEGEVLAARRYWQETYPSMEAKTRNDCLATIRGFVDGMNRQPIRDLFCTTTTVTPNDIFDGAVVIIDMPVHADRATNVLANAIWKVMTQYGAMQRKMPVKKEERDKVLPCLIYADEAHFLAAEKDSEYLSVMRSYRVGTCFLSQNAPEYRRHLGGGKDGVDRMLGLLGNCGTTILHANSCSETYRIYNEQFGNEIAWMKGESMGFSLGGLVGGLTGDGDKGAIGALEGVNVGDSRSQQMQPVLKQTDILSLRNGSDAHGAIADGIWIHGGEILPNGKPWMKFTINRGDDF